MLRVIDYRQGRRRSRKRFAKKWLAIYVLCVFAAEFAGYYVTIPFRQPTANMRYFYYSDSSVVDRTLYYCFYPAYRFDRMFYSDDGGWRYYTDRPVVSEQILDQP